MATLIQKIGILLIVIQLLGLNATIEKQYNLHLARKLVAEKDDNKIIHFGA